MKYCLQCYALYRCHLRKFLIKFGQLLENFLPAPIWTGQSEMSWAEMFNGEIHNSLWWEFQKYQPENVWKWPQVAAVWSVGHFKGRPSEVVKKLSATKHSPSRFENSLSYVLHFIRTSRFLPISGNSVPIFRTCHNPASFQKTSIIYTRVGIGEDKRLTLAMYSYNETRVWLTKKGLWHWKVLNELFRPKADAATVVVLKLRFISSGKDLLCNVSNLFLLAFV